MLLVNWGLNPFPGATYLEKSPSPRVSRLPQVLKLKAEMEKASPPYSSRTISSYIKNLVFLDRHIDLNDANSVVGFIRSHDVSDLRKMTLCNAYSAYCRVFDIQIPQQKLRGGVGKVYKKLPEVPSEHVIDKIIDVANPFYALIEFLKCTGCRTIELTNLHVDDLKGNVLTIRTAKSGGMKSRHVRLPDRLVERVKRMVNGRNVGYLFEDKGRQLTEHRLRKAIIRYREEVVEKYGLNEAKKVHLHTFRHFYATKVYNETKDLVLVKTLLGHSSVRTTEVYTHIMQFDDSRCEAKAIPVNETDQVCKMLEHGWQIASTTSNHIFLKHYLH